MNRHLKSDSDSIILIALIEDNRFTRSGWEVAFNATPDCNVVGSFGSCEDALQSDSLELADLVLMDIGLPGMSGIECVKQLREKYPEQLIIMCTVHEDDEKIFEALCAGAVGYLLKNTSPEDLVQAVRDAIKGGSPMTPSVARKVIASFQRPIVSSSSGRDKLSEREEQVLRRMAQGKTYSAIAEELFLSIDGVSYHIRHIYEKLQVNTRAEAVAKGLKNRLIPPLR